MAFRKEYLDLILIPSGLLIMFAYHLYLLYRYIKLPQTTAIGAENNDKCAWVKNIMQVENKDNPINVIGSNISAATFFASVALTLCSLIGTWIGTSPDNFFRSELIYGDIRPSTIFIKYICLLSCFLLAFSCFVQVVRHFVHANYLISAPYINTSEEHIKHAQRAVVRGGEFWLLGLRATYFAMNLLLWFFGPIPMFASSVIIVFMLHCHDYNSIPLLLHECPQNRLDKPEIGPSEIIRGDM